MTPAPCSCCGKPQPIDLPIIGIQYRMDNSPALILWNCQCGTTRATKWVEATNSQRVEASLTQMTKESAYEMTCR